MANKRSREKDVQSYSHDEASRLNIPTAEHQPVMADEDKTPIQVSTGGATAIWIPSSCGTARTSKTGQT